MVRAPTGSIRIDPYRMRVEMLRQHVDERADLGRKVVPMRINCVDGVLGAQKIAKNRNQVPRFDVLGDDEARRVQKSLAMQRG